MSETNPHHTTSDHRARLRSAIETAPFRYGILALIGLNAIILGLETSQTVMAAIGPALVLTDRIILAIFVVELLLRIYALGPNFLRDPWGLFDLFVIINRIVFQRRP